MKDFWVNDIGARLYIRDETDIFGLMQTGHYEPEETEMIRKLVKKSDICVDIGANIGYYTVLMAKIGKFVYAFEPEPENYKVLINNVSLNELENTHALMLAIGDENDVVDMHICPSNHGMHRMYASKWCNSKIPVKSVTLDDEFGKLEPDFVKIDVEGWEMHVLAGMTRMVEHHLPTMMVEFHPPTFEEAGTNPEEVYMFFKDFSYDIYLAPDLKHKIAYNDLFSKTNDAMGGQNIVCIPSKN